MTDILDELERRNRRRPMTRAVPPTAPLAQSQPAPFAQAQRDLGPSPVPTVPQIPANMPTVPSPVNVQGERKSPNRLLAEGQTTPQELYRTGQIDAKTFRDLVGGTLTQEEAARRQEAFVGVGRQEIASEKGVRDRQLAQQAELERMREEERIKTEGLTEREKQDYSRKQQAIRESVAQGSFTPEEGKELLRQLDMSIVGLKEFPKPADDKPEKTPQEQFRERFTTDAYGNQGYLDDKGRFVAFTPGEMQGPPAPEQPKAQDPAVVQKELNSIYDSMAKERMAEAQRNGTSYTPPTADDVIAEKKRRDDLLAAYQAKQATTGQFTDGEGGAVPGTGAGSGAGGTATGVDQKPTTRYQTDNAVKTLKDLEQSGVAFTPESKALYADLVVQYQNAESNVDKSFINARIQRLLSTMKPEDKSPGRNKPQNLPR